ncbi:MAG: hypothetical protein J6H18_03535, partial [Lachnospiraceae bacterium]|nr:hypothetical protein [Lachnospiraceae bacterium]
GQMVKDHYGDVYHWDTIILPGIIRNDSVSFSGSGHEAIYEATYFGEIEDSEGTRYAYWRLEDAFEDFKSFPLTDEVLPYFNYPMKMEEQQIYLLEITAKDGSVEREFYRTDNYTWEGYLTSLRINDAPLRWQNKGFGFFLPEEPIAMEELARMAYERPDTEQLYAAYDALARQAESSSDAEALLEGYQDIFRRRIDFVTMMNLAMFRNDLDTTDPFYQEEVDFCNVHGVLINEKEAALMAAFAASPGRNALEQQFFGAGYFRYYDAAASADAEDPYSALAEQEQALISRYKQLTGAPQVTYQGETKQMLAWQESDSVEVQEGAYAAYIEQYHDSIGGIFLEMLKVRRQQAEYYDYENYMNFSYANYRRGFSVAQAQSFLSAVQKWLVPLMEGLYVQNPGLRLAYSETLDEDPLALLASAAGKMGGPIAEAFRFMEAYKLYDISASATKRRISYTAYLSGYEAPFIFLNPMEHKDVYATLAHEFGHYVDSYHNYNAWDDYEMAETFSQSMVYLAIANASGLPEEEREEGLRMALIELLIKRIAERCAYADFEIQVYCLDPEEVTLEELDAIWNQCRQDYGLRDLYPEEVRPMGWVKDLYFFTHPGYVISYPTSAVAALEICQLEAEAPGAGASKFCELLDYAARESFVRALSLTGLDSPFREAAIQEIAGYLKKALELP